MWRNLTIPLAVGLLLALAGPSPASGAERLRSQIGALVLEAPVLLRGELDRLSERAREVVPRVEADLGVRARAPYRIVLLPAPGLFDDELEQIDRLAPPWAAGFMVGQLRLGAIRLTQVRRYPYDDAVSVLLHEVTHMLLWDAAGGSLPRWFGEGVATWSDRRWGIRDFAVQSGALLSGGVPQLAALDDEFTASSARARRAYAAAFDFISWSVKRYGRDFLPELLGGVADRPLEEAWADAAGTPLASSEASWRRSTSFWHRWVPLLASSGTLWLGITGLALLAGVRRRSKTRQIYRRWEEEQLRAGSAEPLTEGEGEPRAPDEDRWVN